LLALPGLAAPAGAVQLPATNQTTCFDANGIQRACTGTGEDGEKQAGVKWPTPRFDVKNDGTVKDKLTGLTWSRHANAPDRSLPGGQPNNCPNAESDMLWVDALDFIKCLNTSKHAGSSDWRLPNLNELESIMHAGFAETSTYLNANGFGFGADPTSQVQAGQYWTATSDASAVDLPGQSAAAAWEIDLFTADSPLSSTLKNEKKNRVWPVRGVSTEQAGPWRTGQTLCFNDVGDPRPCALTGEDGEKLAGAAWPVPRFKTSAGATIAVDGLTGLIWPTDTQTPGPAANLPGCNTGTNLTWQEALDHVACLNANKFLGRRDWRLPNSKELHSLADYSRGNPALPAGHPFNDQAGNKYWSATTDLSMPAYARVVSMSDGSLSSAVKAGALPVWPVSGPDLPSVTTASPNPGIYSGSVTVTLTTSEKESKIYVTTEGTPVSTSSPVYSAPIVLKPTATTTYNVQFFSVSSMGMVEEVKSASYTVHVNDLTGSMMINAGAQQTSTPDVTLTLAAKSSAGVGTMQFSNDGVNFSAPEKFATTRSWTLSSGDGPKTVHVKFTDGLGSAFAPVAATITLNTPSPGTADTTAPATIVTPAPGTYSDRVTVTLMANEAATIHYTTNGTTPTASSPVYAGSFELAASATTMFNVQYFAVDPAGNSEQVKSAIFTVYVSDLTGTTSAAGVSNGDLNGDKTVDLRDALRAMQIAIGLSSPTLDEMVRGDVAPLLNGKPRPDGKIDIADAMIMLQRSLGLVAW